MIEKGESTFSLSKDNARLVFRTANFVADKGSVLHSGIYNREFSSVLASFASAGMAYFILAMRFGKETVFYLIFMLLFIATFPLFRRFVFREHYLETVLDRADSAVLVSLSWIRKKILIKKQLESIAGLRIDSRKSEVVNRDGVEFVERISAMHGTVIPGFGEETVFYSLMLCFSDGMEKTIFADSNIKDVLAVYDEIKEFLKI